jgi:hypothetical protein
MQRHGAARSIVIDEAGVILAGNATAEAAADAGITQVKVVDADGETLVAVRRTGLTPQQKIDLALSDNRANDLSEFDPDVLKALEEDGADLSALWTEDERAEMFADPEPVKELTVDQPLETVWVLLAIPLDKWPEHQATVEMLQGVATYSGVVVRGPEK